MLDLSELKEMIKAEAKRLGFLRIGIAPTQPVPHFQEFKLWVQSGFHADMGYLSRPDTLAKREDPGLILEGSQRVIALAMPYQPHQAALKPAPPGYGKVSSFAQVHDYHETIADKLNHLTDFIANHSNKAARTKAYVDTGPILERGFAALAGLGTPGKNSCLIIPPWGSYHFLAEILTDLPLPIDPPFTRDLCGSCRRCIEACPTGCILEDRTIDASRCISYLTIENKGIVPGELKGQIEDWFFGCDVCQAVCPHNARLPNQSSPLGEAILPECVDLASLLNLNQENFLNVFKSTALLRAKHQGLIRNAAVVLGNQEYLPALPSLEDHLTKSQNPIIHEACEWAIRRIKESQV